MPGVVYTFSFQITNPAAAQVRPNRPSQLGGEGGGGGRATSTAGG